VRKPIPHSSDATDLKQSINLEAYKANKAIKS